MAGAYYFARAPDCCIRELAVDFEGRRFDSLQEPSQPLWQTQRVVSRLLADTADGVMPLVKAPRSR